MNAAALILLTLGLTAADNPEQINPLFRELRQIGVPLHDKVSVPLPAPTLADRPDLKAQKAAIDLIAGKDYDPKDVLRPAVVAPFRYQVRDLESPDPNSRAFAVDVWFVAHGDLETITRKGFLDNLLKAGNKNAKVHILTEDELAKRKLEAKKDGPAEERYSHAVFTLLDDVQLRGTTHTVLSRTPDSLLVAARLDPRFTSDPDFPNQSRVIKVNNGQKVLGPARPYAGSGSYLKITRLSKEAAGRDDALFVEGHMVFVEPREWFGGTNQLRSKIGSLVQDQVRSFRAELNKQKPKK
ncbi:MAG TPA: hypothetical protein VNK04_16010 [Gemmataceae bacterium]|nr:hypothetical protein [Gemmataceae bacterium]